MVFFFTNYIAMIKCLDIIEFIGTNTNNLSLEVIVILTTLVCRQKFWSFFDNIRYYIGHVRSALMSKVRGMLSVHLMDCMIWMNKELSEKIAEL